MLPRRRIVGVVALAAVVVLHVATCRAEHAARSDHAQGAAVVQHLPDVVETGTPAVALLLALVLAAAVVAAGGRADVVVDRLAVAPQIDPGRAPPLPAPTVPNRLARLSLLVC